MKLEVLNALDSKGILKELNAPLSKEAVASALSRVKIPNKKSEKYRYFDIEPLTTKSWSLAKALDNKPKITRKIAIKDGILESITNLDGVSVEIKEFNDIDTKHFDGLYYVSHLLAKEAIVIRVSKDNKLNIEHIFEEEDVLINYRVVILVDANVHCEIFNNYSGKAEGSFVLSGYDIFVSRDASLKFVQEQTLNANNYTPIITSRYKIDTNATFKLSTFDFAKENGLNIFKAELKENANIDSAHLLYASSNTKNGTVSEIVHEGINSKSNQVAKSILDDKARGIFDALIRVQNSAKGTKAHQNSKSVLLKSAAYMASKPQLEIYIDDLEASHGSTTGQLDEKQLFYLRSRGIKENEAKKMLILAFANEVIATIDDEYNRNRVHSHFEEAYYGKAELECILTCHSCEDSIV